MSIMTSCTLAAIVSARHEHERRSARWVVVVEDEGARQRAEHELDKPLRTTFVDTGAPYLVASRIAYRMYIGLHEDVHTCNEFSRGLSRAADRRPTLFGHGARTGRSLRVRVPAARRSIRASGRCRVQTSAQWPQSSELLPLHLQLATAVVLHLGSLLFAESLLKTPSTIVWGLEACS